MIKVGICGIGFMGKMHYGVYSGLPNVKVAAIADPGEKKRGGQWKEIMGNIPGKTQDIVDVSDVHTYKDFSDLIDDPDVDIVDITLPTPLHHEAAVAALKNGKHVFLEKPIARTPKLANKIIQESGKSKKYIMIGQCIRFWPEYALLKMWHKGKKFGKLISATFRRVSPTPTYTVDDWILNGSLSGGAALDLHIHDTDFISYLLGKPKAVCSSGSNDRKMGPVTINTHYIYHDNISVTAEGGWCYPSGFPFEMSFVIVYSKAVVEFNMNKTPALVIYHSSGKKEIPTVPGGTGYSAELAYFVKCVSRNQKPLVATVADAYTSLKIVEAEVKSMMTGRTVPIK